VSTANRRRVIDATRRDVPPLVWVLLQRRARASCGGRTDVRAKRDMSLQACTQRGKSHTPC
jgi:hypothetical protein